MDAWDDLRAMLPPRYAEELVSRLLALRRRRGSGSVAPPVVHVARGRVVAAEWDTSPAARFKIGRRV